MATKNKVLERLMQAQDFLSGEQIAQELSLSRTAIWKAINELRKDGYSIESVTNKGYRYLPSDILSAEGIRMHLAATTPAMEITVVKDSDSTIKDAKIAAINGAPTNTLIVADQQNAPKGRFQRPFFAQAGHGIYLGLLLRPNQNFDEIAQYTVMMAVAVTRAIEATCGKSTEIKWVNDIYLNGKKICGILSEAMTDVESGQITNVVIGLGINFSIPQADFPAEIQNKATSLFADAAPTLTRNELIAAIWNEFYLILNDPAYTNFIDDYRKKSFVLGKTVTFNKAGTDYQGVATDITDRGELVVTLPQGEPIVLSSGEISLQSIE